MSDRAFLDVLDERIRQIANEAVEEIARKVIGVDVRDFGAKGDGRDDTAAFSKATEVEGEIKIPKGTFLVSGIELHGNQWLRGQGRSLTTIKSLTPGAGVGIKRVAGSPVISDAKVSGLAVRDFNEGISARGVYESIFEDILLVGNDVNLRLGRGPDGIAGTIWNKFRHIKMGSASIRDLDTDAAGGDPLVNLNQFDGCQFESPRAPQLVGFGGNGLAANSFVGCEFKSGLRLHQTTATGIHRNYFEGGEGQVVLDSANLGVSILGNYCSNWSMAAIIIGYNQGQPGGNDNGVIVGGNSFITGRDAILIPANTSARGIKILVNHYADVVNYVNDVQGIAQF